ncbi:deoxyribonuclease [Bifidobacterium castoris]|uniref:Deoxyribonuclease n=2 Tax=Bifidobacterium castoris TaxID=2306972 RepID=A0A430FAJ7_9BIFI|nr:deoxyribonuclease [Bifidobacterium castoris]
MRPGRGGVGGTLLTMFLVIILLIVLVQSGGWRALSEQTGIGNPDVAIGDLFTRDDTMPERNTDRPGLTLDRNTDKSDTAAAPSPDATTPSPAAGETPRPDGSGSSGDGAAGVSDTAAGWKDALDALDGVRVAAARPGGYDRESKFGDGWAQAGCGKATIRDTILARDLADVARDRDCHVTTGTLDDPYTGQTIGFKRGRSTSGKVQIDHVVALYDAWASGARDWGQDRRVAYANSPDVLLAVDGPANMAKGAGLDMAGTGRYRTGSNTTAPDIWLPDNQAYRCDYMAKRARIKHDWGLTMTAREKQQTVTYLASCVAGSRP